MNKKYLILLLALFAGGFMGISGLKAQQREDAAHLRQLQQQFVDMKFGMFIHFNIPTFMDADWPDPETDPKMFNPVKLDCNQWAAAAKSAKMRYGCLTTKHHSGFCIWNTKTTDYNVMNSPFKRDVVKEYADAFRKQGLKVCLYYSILDTHHRLRPGFITQSHVDMVKAQLTELLTHYGEITAIIIDGWDAPWSRISYEQVPFEEIYRLIKRLQPNCLVMDLNAAKYPKEALFYTDIKSYEQNAGQLISKDANRLPALSCLPINRSWFWKEAFPSDPIKDPQTIVKENIEPLNQAYCNFILNVAPNRDGLIDDNALEGLKKIGQLWNDNASVPTLPEYAEPIIARNIAKHQPVNSSWSEDMMIMDFGNDDNFATEWQSNSRVKNPWYEVDFDRCQSFNMITVTDLKRSILRYHIQYEKEGVWTDLLSAENNSAVKVHRFERVWANKVRLVVDGSQGQVAIAEFGVYDERR